MLKLLDHGVCWTAKVEPLMQECWLPDVAGWLGNRLPSVG